jgi:hypothetical protein
MMIAITKIVTTGVLMTPCSHDGKRPAGAEGLEPPAYGFGDGSEGVAAPGFGHFKPFEVLPEYLRSLEMGSTVGSTGDTPFATQATPRGASELGAVGSFLGNTPDSSDRFGASWPGGVASARAVTPKPHQPCTAVWTNETRPFVKQNRLPSTLVPARLAW